MATINLQGMIFWNIIHIQRYISKNDWERTSTCVTATGISLMVSEKLLNLLVSNNFTQQSGIDFLMWLGSSFYMITPIMTDC